MKDMSRGPAPGVNNLPACEDEASPVGSCAENARYPRSTIRHRLALTALIAILLAHPSPSPAAALAGEWWDVSYGYRKQITISVGTSAVPASTVTALTFDHAALVTAGRSQADGDDIRVLYWTGTAWTELPRIVANGSSWNSASTKILFKIQAQIAGSG